jgi:hypothetical protein
MARAKWHRIPGLIWRITDRCHKLLESLDTYEANFDPENRTITPITSVFGDGFL